MIVPDGIPAIVPQDLFDRVQRKLEQNKKTPARNKAEVEYLLTTKLFCGHCGAYMCGESGKSRNGTVHHYYKCVSVKKKRTNCKKKAVRKQWLEDLVVTEVMKVVMDDKAIEAIASQAVDLQDRENTTLPVLETELREVESGIQNILNAIQMGILTKSTKSRLEELESSKEDLEIKIANEKIAKPRISGEFITFWLHKFRKLDINRQDHRKWLINVFVNAIYLYDDKMVITFNYKDGTVTITLDDVKRAIKKNNTGSDIDCNGAPIIKRRLTPPLYDFLTMTRTHSSGTVRWTVPATSSKTGGYNNFCPGAKMQIESCHPHQSPKGESLWGFTYYLFTLHFSLKTPLGL